MKKYILALLLLFISAQAVIAQQTVVLPCGTADGIPVTFEQKDFDGRFAVLAIIQEEYQYFVIDQTALGSRFERIYFLNLVYGESKLISIDGQVDNDQLWFKAHIKHTEQEMVGLFDELKGKTVQASQSMPDSEKNAWMNKYDKFK